MPPLPLWRSYVAPVSCHVICVGLLAGSAQAQGDGSETFDLGTIVLRGDEGFDAFEEERTIQTFEAEDLERQNIDNLADALDSVANVVVAVPSDPRTFRVTVRGLSDLGNVNATGPTVGLFVDGVLLNQVGSAASFNPGLVDAERVDVFLGPQTTTFGRATTAGAVNVASKKPTDEYELSFEGDLGAFNDRSDFAGSGSFVANAPILKDGLLSGRLVGFYSGNEGFVQVIGVPGSESLRDRSYGGRLSLRSKPTDALTFDLQLSYTRLEYAAPRTTIPVALIEQGIYQSFIDPDGTDFNDDYILRFEAQYESEIGTFSSNSSYRSSETLLAFDGDFIPTVSLTDSEVELRTTSLSQEFRYDGEPLDAGALGGTITINGGLSVNYNEFFASDRVSVGTGGVLGRLATDDRLETLGVSVYGDVAWRPLPPVELSAGVRFAYDRVRTSDLTNANGPLSIRQPLPAPPPALEAFPLVAAERNFTSISPRLAVSYDWSDDVTTFIAYSVGSRPGGISEIAQFVPPGDPSPTLDFFDEETTRSLEIGLRSEFLDGRLGVNATAFYTTIEDFQVPVTLVVPGSFVPPPVILDNVGDAESFGGEISVTAEPAAGWFLQANAGVNFTEIKNFTGTLIGTTPATTPNLNGVDLPNAPKYTFTLAAEYEHPRDLVNGLKPYIRVDYNFRSDFLSGGVSNLVQLSGYDTFDLRLGLRGERTKIELFAENLFNERYTSTATANPILSGPIPFAATGLPPVAAGIVGTPGAPRRIGIRGKIEF